MNSKIDDELIHTFNMSSYMKIRLSNAIVRSKTCYMNQLAVYDARIDFFL